MTQLLRDNIWQFIFSLLSIGLAVYFYLRQRQRKSLSYRVLAKTPLVIVSESVKDRLRVTYDRRPVVEPYLVLLKIVNDGNVPITRGDFETPLSFSLGEMTSIPSVEFADSSPKTLRPTLEVVDEPIPMTGEERETYWRHKTPSTSETPMRFEGEPRITIESTLWNPGDSITLKLLLSQFNGVIECDSRIVGVREVKDITPKESDQRDLDNVMQAFPNVTFIILFAMFLFWVAQYAPEDWKVVLYLIAVILLALSLFFVGAYIRIKVKQAFTK